MSIRHLLFALLLASCGSDTETEEMTSPENNEDEIRETLPVPTVPVLNNTTVNPGDNNTEPDMSEPDMGEDIGVEEDIGPICVCTVGFSRCQGDLEQWCVEDPESVLPDCGKWDTPITCASPQQVCILTQCATPDGCLDNDGDGYGNGCAAGPDCDDTDATTYPGAPELCDGKDNSCNGQIDNGLNVGQACTAGVGACRATGVISCDTGAVECNAVPGMPSAEVCDNIDNDCDGMVDEEEVCGGLCDLDPFEPNETIATAANLTVNQFVVGISCDLDQDYFTFATQNNRQYRVNLPFLDSTGEVKVDLYANGVLATATRSTHFNGERLLFTASPNTTYAVHVSNLSQTATYYQLSVTTDWPCPGEDIFAPNGTRQTAAPLFEEWYIEGGICAGTPRRSDWYSLGVINAGEGIEAYQDETTAYGDMDLYLWHDPNNDGVFTVADYSDNAGNDEEIFFSVSTTGPYYLEVRDYLGNGGPYRLEWFSF